MYYLWPGVTDLLFRGLGKSKKQRTVLGVHLYVGQHFCFFKGLKKANKLTDEAKVPELLLDKVAAEASRFFRGGRKGGVLCLIASCIP